MDDKRSPKKQSIKRRLEDIPPYTLLVDTLRETTTWISKTTLELENTTIYQAVYKDKAGNKVEVPMIPRELYALTDRLQVQDLLEKVDLLNFFQLVPCGIDLQRAHELLSAIKEDGTATLTDLEGEEIQVNITSELIAEALKLSNEGIPIRGGKKEGEVEAFTKKGAAATFSDMTSPQMELPVRLFHQFLFVREKRPARFTTPNHAITSSYTWANQQQTPVCLNHAGYLHHFLTKAGGGSIKYLGAPEMLTRIAYQAIGAAHQLPEAPSQNEWLQMIEEGQRQTAVPRAPPVSTRLKNRLETVEQALEGEKDAKGKRKMEHSAKESVEQKRARLEREQEDFDRLRKSRGDFAEKWKPQGSRLRTKNPEARISEDDLLSEYAEQQRQEEEERRQLLETIRKREAEEQARKEAEEKKKQAELEALKEARRQEAICKRNQEEAERIAAEEHEKLLKNMAAQSQEDTTMADPPTGMESTTQEEPPRDHEENVAAEDDHHSVDQYSFPDPIDVPQSPVVENQPSVDMQAEQTAETAKENKDPVDENNQVTEPGVGAEEEIKEPETEIREEPKALEEEPVKDIEPDVLVIPEDEPPKETGKELVPNEMLISDESLVALTAYANEMEALSAKMKENVGGTQQRISKQTSRIAELEEELAKELEPKEELKAALTIKNEALNWTRAQKQWLEAKKDELPEEKHELAVRLHETDEDMQDLHELYELQTGKLTQLMVRLKNAEDDNEKMKNQLLVAETQIRGQEDYIQSQTTMLQRIRENPSIAAVSKPNAAIRELEKKNKELEKRLKIEARQREDMVFSAMAREEALQRKIDELEARMKAGNVGSTSQAPEPSQTQVEDVTTGHIDLGDIPMEPEDVPMGDAAQAEDPLQQEVGNLSAQEAKRLTKLIEKEQDETHKAAMEWERRIIQSVNVSMVSPQALTKEWYQRFLPLPLLKFELSHHKEEMAKETPPFQLAEEQVDEEEKKRIVDSQPKWRAGWLRKHPQYLINKGKLGIFGHHCVEALVKKA